MKYVANVIIGTNVTCTFEAEISLNEINVLFSLMENGNKEDASQDESSSGKDKNEKEEAGEKVIKMIAKVLGEIGEIIKK